MLWFVKSRRAQSVDDYETWLQGGVVPTINQFDGGDTRATVLILTDPILMRDREGKAGGGKGLLMSNTAFTLSSSNFHALFIPEKEETMDEKEPIVFYGNRVDDIRVQGQVVNTLQARMGTGGGNMPLVSYPIQDGRNMDKNQNGLGLGEEVDPSYTLDSTGGQSVAYSLREDAKANTFSATQTDKALALQGLQPSPQSHHAQIFLAQPSTVRRLTPVECERLQGFEDGWTEGQADTHRYKQMGNAVAVPCVSWIVERMVGLIGD